MAEESPIQKHIFRLSAIDQSVSRTYITVTLCYPCDDEHIDRAATRFRTAVKRTITHLPILAGTVRPASSRDGTERGHLEVAVSLDMIDRFAPLVKFLGGAASAFQYEELRAAHFAPSRLGIEQFALLAPTPDWMGGDAFGAQLNMISGGMIAVLQLHHAVADLAGMQTIVRILSEAGGPRVLTHDVLNLQAVESSRHRDRLSDAVGLTAIPAAPSLQPPSLVLGDAALTATVICVLGFKVSRIDETLVLMADRLFDIDGQQLRTPLAASDVLVAILWRAVIRARMAAKQIRLEPPISSRQPHAMSSLTLPTSFRDRIHPPLNPGWLGNAITNVTPRQEVAALSTPLGIGELQSTASRIRAALDHLSEHTVRRAIAHIKQSDYRPRTPTTTARHPTDVVITTWEDLLPAAAHLSMGLGEPSHVRKLGNGDADQGCTMHPRPTTRRGAGDEPWEVTVQLDGHAMDCLLRDEGVMGFVQAVDGGRYVNGRTEKGDKDDWREVQKTQKDLREARKEWRARRERTG